MVNAKQTKNEFKTIEQQTIDIEEQINLMQDEIDRHNIHLEYMGDLENMLSNIYSASVGYSMELIIRQRNEIIDKQTKLLRKHRRLCREIGLSSTY